MTADDLSGWRAPDAQLVQTALSRIGDPQHRRVFFERLENPQWVSALDAQHVFDSLPETVIDAAGREVWRPWPEGEYLVRMAPRAPKAVGRILSRVTESANPYVHELVLRAALTLPPDEGRALVPAIDGYLTARTLPNAEQVAALIEVFAHAGLRKPAVRLAQAAFRPKAVQGPEGVEGPHRRNVTAGLERYWYEELLPRVAEALTPVLGDGVLIMLAAWLETFQVVSGEFTVGTGHDLSYIWRPAIGDHAQNHRHHELGDSLVEAVRNRALADIAHGRPVADVVAILERSGQPLLRRIAMHVLARSASQSEAARENGFQRLMEPALMDDTAYRHEYAELARAVLPIATPKELGSWEALAEDGPPVSSEVVQDRAQRRVQPDEDLDETIERYREVWQLNLLSGIGAKVLPESAAARLSNLVAKYGEPEHPDFPSYMSSWTGPNSPVTQEDLAERDVSETRAFLDTWAPEGDEPWGPSIEGLARTLQGVVASRPQDFSAAATDFAGLDPTYVRAFFSGLADAVAAGANIDWPSVIEAARLVSLNRDDGVDLEGGMDQDVVWRFAQRSVATLVERGSSGDADNGLPPELLLRAVEAIAPLAHHPDPTPQHEEEYGGSNMDPLTLSLNTTRPAAVRALVRVMSRAKELQDAEGAADYSRSAIAATLPILDLRLRPNRDESLATAAAFGEALGRLIWVDRQWTEEHAGELLTDDAWGDVVLSVALSTYRPSGAIAEVVKPAARQVIARVAAGGTAVSGWRTDRSPVELIGDALVLLRIQGVIEANDSLLVYFFETAPLHSRTRVLGHLGWLLMQSEDVPGDALDRARELWEGRAKAVAAGETSIDELADFYWWVRSDKFDRSWWLPHLLQALESDDFDAAGMLGEVLEQTAPSAPEQVAAILERLLSKRGEKPFTRYDLVEHAPAVIAEALDSADPDLRATGQRIMDLLGRGGHLRIAELVEQRRLRRGGIDS